MGVADAVEDDRLKKRVDRPAVVGVVEVFEADGAVELRVVTDRPGDAVLVVAQKDAPGVE